MDIINDNGGDATFRVQPMFKSDLMQWYNLTVDQWDTWVKQLHAIHAGAIHKTRAKLGTKAVQIFVDHFGNP